MKRRNFLQKAAVGSASLASLTSVVNSLAAPVQADGQTNFHFVAVSQAGPPGTPTSPQHRFAMSGDGKITPSNVVGGGSINHFLFPGSIPPVGGTPLPLVGTATWKARSLISLDLIGTYGVFAAGILEMEINIIRDGLPVLPATLKVVCNIGFAGLSTGQEEGFTLIIPGGPFVPGGTFGPIEPLVPALGITAFSTANESRD
jgi:hypothetical protein